MVAALHIIHSVIQPSTVSEHTGVNPMSLNKLKADKGLCETMEELLRWMIDRVTQYNIAGDSQKRSWARRQEHR